MQQRKRKEKNQKISRLTFKLAILTAIFYVITFMVIGLFLPQDTVSAAPVIGTGAGGYSISSQWGPTDTAESYVLYGALTACINNTNIELSSISSPDASAGKWFSNPSMGATNPRIGYFLTGMNSGLNTGGGGENVGCGGNNIGWIGAAATLWGYNDPLALLCDIGATTVSQRPCGSPNESYAGPTDSSQFHTNVSAKIGTTNPPTLSAPANYVLYSSAFKGGCLGSEHLQPWTNPADSGNAFYYKNVTMVDNSGNSTTDNYIGIRKPGDSIWVFTDPGGADHKFKCSELVNKMNQYSAAYQAATILTPDVPSRPAATGGVGTGDTNKTTCAIGGIGWIVCPVVNFMANMADHAYGYLADNFLSVKIEAFNTNSPTYSAWSIMRGFANVAFVIVFLIIIFSQLTGFGIDNYGVKKLLPRIIIAAILVNLSYFICQLSVDLSNILGKSFSDLFIGIAVPQGNISTGFWSGGSWANIATEVLAGAAGAAVLWTSLPSLIPMLLLAVFALVMVLFILMARQAIIILLVVISPLAFVAYLLPNTEQWFTKWRKTLTSMLLLYPIVALVYGVSAFASKILAGVMDTGPLATRLIGEITAASVVVLPLFLIPSLLKKSLDGVGNIGATLNNWGSKAGKAARKKGSEVYTNSSAAQYKNYRAAEAAKRRAQIQSGSYSGRGGNWNPRNLTSKAHKKFNESSVSGQFGDRRSAQGEAMLNEAEAKDIAQAQTLLEAKIARGETDSYKEFNAATQRHDIVGAKAALNIQLQTASGRTAAHELLKLIEEKDDMQSKQLVQSLKRHVASTQPDIDSKDAALGEWSHKSTGDRDQISIESIEGDSNTYAINDAKMAGQTVEGLATAFKYGKLDQPIATRILGTENLAASLKPKERTYLENLSQKGVPPTDSTYHFLSLDEIKKKKEEQPLN